MIKTIKMVNKPKKNLKFLMNELKRWQKKEAWIKKNFFRWTIKSVMVSSWNSGHLLVFTVRLCEKESHATPSVILWS